MARPSTGANLNIAQLEEILGGRRHELSKLAKQRSTLERKLDAIDREIAKLEGGVGGTGRRRGRPPGSGGNGARARNEKSLVQTIEEVLTETGEPMRVADIFQAVLKTGYKTNSANPKGIVNQALIKEKRFTQSGRGVYQLKK